MHTRTRSLDRSFALVAAGCGAVLWAMADALPDDDGTHALVRPQALAPYLLALGALLAWPVATRARQVALGLLAALTFAPGGLSFAAAVAIAATAVAGIVAQAAHRGHVQRVQFAVALLLVPAPLLVVFHALVVSGLVMGPQSGGVAGRLAALLVCAGLMGAAAAVALALWRQQAALPGRDPRDDGTAFGLTLMVTIGAPLTATVAAVLGGAAAAGKALETELVRQRAHLASHALALEAEIEQLGPGELVLGAPAATAGPSSGRVHLYWNEGTWLLKPGLLEARRSGAADALFQVAHAADTRIWLCQPDGRGQRCWSQHEGAPELVQLPAGQPPPALDALAVSARSQLGLTALVERTTQPLLEGALYAMRALVAPALALSLLGMVVAAGAVVPMVRRLDRLRRNLSVLVEHAPAAVVTLDARGQVEEANAAAHALLAVRGVQQPEPGTPLAAVVAAAERGVPGEAADPAPVELRWTDAAGRLVEVEVTAHAVPGELPGRRVVLVHDVTRRNLAEEKLRRTAQWTEAVLRAAGEGIAVVDAAGRLVLANPVALETLGLPPDPAPCAAAPLPVGEPFATPWQGIVQVARRHRETWRGDLVLPCPGGHARSIAVVTTPLGGGDDSLVVVLRDETERRRTAEALAFTTALLRNTEEIGRIGSWHVDLRTGVSTWSEGKFRIHGLAPGTPLSPDLHLRYVHPDDRARLQALIDDVLARRVPHEVRYRIVVDGNVKWVEGRGSFHVDAQGEPIAWSGSMQDITDLQLRERDLLRSRRRVRQLAARREQEREEERARLAREVHDELGQQLTALRLSVRRLELQCAQGGFDAGTAIGEMKAQLDQTSGVVRSLVHSLRPAVLDYGLAAAVEWLASDAGARLGVPIQLHNDLDDRAVPADVSTAVFRGLQEALTNVARHAEASHVRVRLAVEDTQLLLEVEDDGRGFDARTARGKRSFGLMGMRERALSLGGSLRVTSEPGHGTRLALRVPLQPPDLGALDKDGDIA